MSSSRGLPIWGLMLRGVCWELITSVRRTSETACGSLLPTPTGAGNEGSPSMQKWPAHRELSALVASQSLGNASSVKLCPTPTCRDWKSGKASEATHARNARPLNEVGERDGLAMLPTPTAQLYGYNRGGAAGRVGKVRPSLEVLTGGVFIALREWMMGWPIGWSASAPLATVRYRRWLRSHGAR